MKKSLKKGGVAEIVSLMIIVGIVLALIIAVVVPMANKARTTGSENTADQDTLDGNIDTLKVPVA